MRMLFSGVFVLALGAAAAHAAPIVTNGDFSNGLTGWSTGGSFGVSPGSGPQVITLGQSNSSGYGDYIPTYNGNHAAFFVDDAADETLSQSVQLAANTKYNLSFGLFATESGARNPNNFTLFNNISGLSQTFTNSDVAVGAWTTQNASFSSTSAGAYTLSFEFQSGPYTAKDVAVGGIAISTVPLPASAPLFGAALLALAGFGYSMNRWVAPKGGKAASA